jgi:hypothetical protein
MNKPNSKPELSFDCLECEAHYTAATLPADSLEAWNSTDDDRIDCPVCLHGDLIGHRGDWGLKAQYPPLAPSWRQ